MEKPYNSHSTLGHTRKSSEKCKTREIVQLKLYVWISMWVIQQRQRRRCTAMTLCDAKQLQFQHLALCTEDDEEAN